MGRAVSLSVSMAILLLIPGSALAATTISEANYHPDDYFEYEGHTQALLDGLVEQWQDDADFEGITMTANEEMRVTHLADESCQIINWNGGCNKALVTHLVNITVNWVENSTQYDNDTLNMSIEYSAYHWTSTGSAGWEKLQATTTTQTWFSGGGEDNHLEHEFIVTSSSERIGDWPDRIELNSTWDVEETVKTHTIDRTRENKGLWQESESNISTTQQVAYRALRESEVFYGIANEKSHDTMVIERTELTTNLTRLDYFRSEGFLARTETWQDGELQLSATLVDYRYYENEPHASSVTSNWLLPTVLICLLLLGLLGAGSAFAAISSAPQVRTESQDDT